MSAATASLRTLGDIIVGFKCLALPFALQTHLSL